MAARDAPAALLRGGGVIVEIVLAEIGPRSAQLSQVERALAGTGFEIRLLEGEGPPGAAAGRTRAPPALCVALDRQSRDLGEALAFERALRERWAAAHLLVLTDRARPDELEALLAAGADDLAAWPAEAPLLAARTRKILQCRRERMTLERRCAELDTGGAGGSDATRRSRAEYMLARSNERYRALLAGIPDIILRVDRDGVCLDAHARGLPELNRHLVGRPAGDFLPADTAVQARTARLAALATGTVQMAELAVTVQGEPRILEARLVPVGREEVILVARDVTERRQMEQQLRLAERMASLGTLAAGVAHEINNPLAFTLLYLEMAAGELKQSASRAATAATAASAPSAPSAPSAESAGAGAGRVAEAIEHALTGVSRVQRIVKDLREFSRADDEDTAPVDVHRALQVSLHMAAGTLRHRAQVVCDLAPVPLVRCNPVRLEQVFLNLLTNAAQAIPEGSAAQHEVRVSARVADDGGVLVEIRDTGPGIPPEVLPRIFDPFFTTKPIGQGTGLGLAICHRIVTSLGGAIHIDSTPGSGTTARVTLPPASPAEAPAPESSPVVGISRRKVLVVDDEELLLRAVQRMLEGDHEVHTESSARAVLGRMTRGERFDTLLCDLLMPDLGGVELYREMQARFPEQAARIIFITGNAFSPETQEFLRHVPNPHLLKPFGKGALAALLAARAPRQTARPRR